MSDKVLNVGTHPVDLDSGRTLAPGDRATIDIEDPHNQSLIEQGHIIVVVPKSATEDDDDEKAKAAEPRKDTTNREDKKS